MKYTSIIVLAVGLLLANAGHAQDLKEKAVPEKVKNAFSKKYPEARKVSWEIEKGNYEANWGGTSGEDNSAIFTPAGEFEELVQAIPLHQLPASIVPYVTKHYKGVKINEAGKVTDAAGKHLFEVEIKGKELMFDEKGSFIKEE